MQLILFKNVQGIDLEMLVKFKIIDFQLRIRHSTCPPLGQLRRNICIVIDSHNI